MLVFIAPRLPVAIPDFGCAWVASAVVGQPAVLARAKAGHKACESCHCPRLFLVEVSGEPFIPDTVFESCQGFGIWTVDDLVLLGERSVPKLTG